MNLRRAFTAVILLGITGITVYSIASNRPSSGASPPPANSRTGLPDSGRTQGPLVTVRVTLTAVAGSPADARSLERCLGQHPTDPIVCLRDSGSVALLHAAACAVRLQGSATVLEERGATAGMVCATWLRMTHATLLSSGWRPPSSFRLRCTRHARGVTEHVYDTRATGTARQTCRVIGAGP